MYVGWIKFNDPSVRPQTTVFEKMILLGVSWSSNKLSKHVGQTVGQTIEQVEQARYAYDWIDWLN